MAERLQITCINKTNRTSHHERIHAVGGKGWKLLEDAAIQRIENGSTTFYVHVSGLTVDVTVATREGKKYLKTVADGERPDNLLSLGECA